MNRIDRSKFNEQAYGPVRVAYHSLLLQRIYHEDNLFAQRTYTFFAVHAFLAAAFAVLFTSACAGIAMTLLLLMTVLGASIALFQALYGRQTNCALAFWREYVKNIEQKWDVPFDRLQYDFYEAASVGTPFGNMEKERSYQKPRDTLFPWWISWVLKPFASLTEAVPTIFSPMLIIFWGAAARLVLLGSGHPRSARISVFVVLLMIAAVVYQIIFLAKPKKEDRPAEPTKLATDVPKQGD